MAKIHIGLVIITIHGGVRSSIALSEKAATDTFTPHRERVGGRLSEILAETDTSDSGYRKFSID